MEGRASGTQTRAYVAIILLACCPCASALNPSLDINQYAHNAWTIRDGFFQGVVTSIAQTPDGYLWIGTEFGLLRFDGVRFVPWLSPDGEQLPGAFIRSLLAARDGRLWIGTTEGLANWKDGKLTHSPELAGEDALTLLEDLEGTIWAGGTGPNRKLCAIQSGHATCYGEDGRLGRSVLSLYEDSGGRFWVGAATGLWRWKPGPPTRYPLPDARALIENGNSTLLITAPSGIRQLVDEKVEAYQLPGAGSEFNPNRLLRDRNGGLWIGTSNRGLLHVHDGRTDVFARSDGLSGDQVEAIFEDAEGSIWVATLDGLDRFRDFAVPTISVRQGLSTAVVSSVLAAMDGSVWLGTANGLNGWSDGHVTIYRKGNGGLPDDIVESLFQDDRGRIWVYARSGVAYFENGRFVPVRGVPRGSVYSMTGDRTGNLWISHDDQGLFRLVAGSVVEQIPWARVGHKGVALSLLIDPVRGGLWLGFGRGGGVAYFRDGRVRASYSGSDGLGRGRVEGLRLDQDGALWAATEGGLSRLKNGRIATLTSKNGLPCDTVHWMMEDNDHSFWLYMGCGLVRIGRPELEAWVTDSRRKIQITVFDSSDGVRSHSTTAFYSPTVAKTTDGKLWFLPFDGVGVIDPRHIPVNKLRPPVHIEEITADRKSYWNNITGVAPSRLRLPPLVRDLVIDYTACSLVAAEKVRFRVKLEGRDPDWKDVGNERKAFYNDLSPRHYRFRVKACNNSGVWNEAGDSLEFSIDPSYYQTTWFKASCGAAFMMLLWGLYRYRLHQIAQEFNMRLEERVNERTRIARELHDTLLQSFHGLMFRLQAARNMLPRRPAEAIEALDGAITRAEQAIAEGRGAIQDLRAEPEAQSDLAHLLTAMGQELAGPEDGGGDSPVFGVTVEGAPQTLDPILQDEIYRIAREALRNAFRHARAGRIEAEIRYDDRGLRLRIRDDGKGIEPGLLKAGGRAGHWGLTGLRERAKRIGAQVDLWSEAGAGTEVQLTVPASVAYAAPHSLAGRGLLQAVRHRLKPVLPKKEDS